MSKHKTAIVSQDYELVPVAAIEPHPQNVNVGDVAAIVDSIKHNRFYGACIVQRSSSRILAGKHRWLAAKECGLEVVPVIWADVDDAEAVRIMLADNRTTRLGADDPKALAELLQGLPSLDGTGFDATALDELLGSLNTEPAPGLTDDDSTPEPPEAPVTLPGDLWRLGEHRVLCGDSTASDAVSRLLGATVPFLMVTDPPYGVEYDPGWRQEAADKGFIKFGIRATGKVQNDDIADWSPAFEHFKGDVAYIWSSDRRASDSVVSIIACGFEIRNQIIWVKQHFVLSRGHYNPQHEPCWYAVRKGKTSHWKGDMKQSTAWEIPNANFQGRALQEKADARTNHGTQKPVECMRRPIVNHTVPGEAVYDPFLGSGTTLIACEKEGRICYGLELDPKYVDVIVKRWQDFTGKQAVLADGDHAGQTFEQVKFGRRLGAQDAVKEEILARP